MQLVELLRATKMKQRLRAARKAFAERFPLQDHLWTQWLEDAMEDLGDGVTQSELLELAGLAVCDYVSCNLWVQYLSCAPVVDSIAVVLAACM